MTPRTAAPAVLALALVLTACTSAAADPGHRTAARTLATQLAQGTGVTPAAAACIVGDLTATFGATTASIIEVAPDLSDLKAGDGEAVLGAFDSAPTRRSPTCSAPTPPPDRRRSVFGVGAVEQDHDEGDGHRDDQDGDEEQEGHALREVAPSAADDGGRR